MGIVVGLTGDWSSLLVVEAGNRRVCDEGGFSGRGVSLDD